MLKNCRSILCLLACAGVFFSGCTASQHRKAADKETYTIVGQKQIDALGKTNAFTVDTRYSARDPKDIKPPEIILERKGAEKRTLTVADALKLAVENSRTYQTQKENLFLTALTLTEDRFDFGPKFFASSTAGVTRDSDGVRYRNWNNSIGATQVMKNGGRLSVELFNDVLRYYTGNTRSTIGSGIVASITQPLLRGAGASIAAERLTQSERNVIYSIRAFSRFQNTFAVDTLTSYYRLLQQKDTVRNEYRNYSNLVTSRERAEALAKNGRLPAFQADQAQQDEFSAKIRYIAAVESYRSSLDNFKLTLGIPLGVDLVLDDSALEELATLGLAPVPLSENSGYEIAVEHRLDFLNDVDRFEDSKRKIKVAANRLKADLNFVADVGLSSQGATDYTRFKMDDYTAGAGVQLNLPLNRMSERNEYRTVLIDFERQIRTLSLSLDNLRGDVRQGVRALDQNRQNYEIQKNAVALADRRVESAKMLQERGRAQIRDYLDAQSSQLQARNALSKALVDYHVARLNLLIDLGMLDTEQERFWTLAPTLPGKPGETPTTSEAALANPATAEVISPEQLFGK